MSVPKFFEFFEAFLKALHDGETHTAKDVQNSVIEDMHLTPSDLSEMLPSGKQLTFINRINWARTYLNKAGLIETPLRGNYRITEEGKKALASGEKIDLKYLNKFKAFREFHGSSITDPDPDPEVVKSPLEILEDAYQSINDKLSNQLRDEIMKLSPTDFEKLVVKLLLKMGYGNGIDEAGMVTPPSKDDGIDGVIKEDQFGFSNIYIQAKKWAEDVTVGKPELQKFVGALSEQHAQKGLFITTSKFSSGAIQFAKNSSGAKVKLVDGKALTKLMIKHNVGVTVESIYEIKKIDTDFFADEL